MEAGQKPLTGLIKKYLTQVKFILSSFASFLIDFGLRILFGLWMIGELANVSARIISATFNFFVNKNAVFKGDETALRAALKYALLAFFVMCVDTLINEELLIRLLNIPSFISKPITEVIMFLINYPIQKKFVYTKRNPGSKTEAN